MSRVPATRAPGCRRRRLAGRGSTLMSGHSFVSFTGGVEITWIITARKWRLSATDKTDAQRKSRAKKRGYLYINGPLDDPLVPKERIELSRGVASADFESATSTVPPLRRGRRL